MRTDDDLLDEIETATGGAGPDPVESRLIDLAHTSGLARPLGLVSPGEMLSPDEVRAEVARRGSRR